MASTYLTRTFSTPTNRKIFTWSAWVKRQNQVTDYQNAMFGAYYNSSVRSVFRFNAHQLNFQDTEGSVEIKTNRLFRDVNAWYHIVLSVDTTQATASNRVKMYVNGVQETSFYQGNYPAQNSNFLMGGADIHYINARNSSGSVDSIADMSYSHIHFTDGTAYDATPFGSQDATTGEWKIKTDVSVTYGNNGFFILKDGNSVTDQSGNGNNWTVASGTLTKTEDCPDNVFATMNPLDNYWQGANFSCGNTKVGTGDSSQTFSTSTLMMTSGKFYAEVKLSASATANIGVTGEQAVNASQTLASRGSGYAYVDSGSVSNNGSSVGGTWSSYANGDIVGIAINLDDEQDGLNKLYFSKNGVWQNGANPSTPSSVTGVVGITKPSNLTGGESKMGAYAFAMNDTWNDNSRTFEWNFGNGYFGTTQISSAGTNASGNGIFEYDVPTGFTALSTKGLNL